MVLSLSKIKPKPKQMEISTDSKTTRDVLFGSGLTKRTATQQAKQINKEGQESQIKRRG